MLLTSRKCKLRSKSSNVFKPGKRQVDGNPRREEVSEPQSGLRSNQCREKPHRWLYNQKPEDIQAEPGADEDERHEDEGTDGAQTA
jgi:hypothetical protein